GAAGTTAGRGTTDATAGRGTTDATAGRGTADATAGRRTTDATGARAATTRAARTRAADGHAVADLEGEVHEGRGGDDVDVEAPPEQVEVDVEQELQHDER